MKIYTGVVLLIYGCGFFLVLCLSGAPVMKMGGLTGFIVKAFRPNIRLKVPGGVTRSKL